MERERDLTAPLPPSDSMYCRVHCTKHNMNLSIKTEPATAGADATVYIRLLFTVHITGPETSSCSKLGTFYAEIQNIFGRVYRIVHEDNFYHIKREPILSSSSANCLAYAGSGSLKSPA